ncbi:hypothetical protein SPRG_01334 [Saprolegnia parasitica CBS 223.65]|uniref:Uncharacterized protein n=1 Tax=Saprolegnia parasitica (strain CBS 223.65) TaxID=695850 RepID=A0A067CXS1_SAPPC|nr:hypothetical protein SPRG_01334 [Saprolegnia parasitica CBS 223.65]KDO34060.1 hypothetical protein SPRG_01334 [Saprolegnia parasitica CBS 223.65]|eukprot:XP_012194944.1 hypothetical protein SPRG_01334 [Saprolegnia parasitica CBS 223.65]
MAAVNVLVSPDLLGGILAYQDGLSLALLEICRLAETIRLVPSGRVAHKSVRSVITNVPVRFASLPYLCLYPQPTTTLSTDALFLSPYAADPALPLHLSIVEGNLSHVRQWLASTPHLCTSATLELAAAASQGSVLQLLLRSFSHLLTPKVMDLVAMSGDLPLVQYLDARGAACSTAAMDGAAMHGHLDVVRFLHAARKEGCTTAAATAALMHGHADALRFLLVHRTEGVNADLTYSAPFPGHVRTRRVVGTKFLEALELASAITPSRTAQETGLQHAVRIKLHVSKPMLDMAIARQDAAMLRFVLDALDDVASRDDVPERDRWTTSLDLAAYYGDLVTVQHLNKRGIPVSERAMAHASYRGHLHVMQWLAKQNGSNGSPRNALVLAAAQGHLHVVQWLVAHGYDLDTCDAALTTAAYRGDVALATYLAPLVPPSDDKDVPLEYVNASLPPHDDRLDKRGDFVTGRAADAAAAQGHLNIICELQKFGHLVSRRALLYAIENGHLSVVEHLTQNDATYQCDVKTLVRALQRGHRSIVTFLVSERSSVFALPPTEEDVYRLYIAAASTGDLALLRLIGDTYGRPLTSTLPLRVQERMLLSAATNGHLDAVQLLHEMLGFVAVGSIRAVATRLGYQAMRRYTLLRHDPKS